MEKEALMTQESERPKQPGGGAFPFPQLDGVSASLVAWLMGFVFGFAIEKGQVYLPQVCLSIFYV